MGKVVDRILAKVTRAKQHIQDFQLGVSAFHETKPYTVGIKEDPQSGQRIYYVTKTECIPDALTAIAADVIQNLRSPLDHIAYQLVLDARGGTPITSAASEYPALRARNIKGVRQEVIDAIDATEPYKSGKGHGLWQLNQLNKPDKHELLVGAGAISTGVDISVDFNSMLKRWGIDAEFPPVFLSPADKLLSLKVGDELYIEPINRKMEENRRFTFDVSLNAPGIIEPEPALKTLQDMTNLVDGIVAELGRFLP